jgi:mannan endo-1,4-beta-mannosidase
MTSPAQRCWIAVAVWLALLSVYGVGSPAGADAGFVGRRGTAFELDGKVFVPVGVNNHYLTFGTPGEVVRVLDGAANIGANVVRTFLQPVIGVPGAPAGSTIWDYDSKFETSNLGVNGHYMLFWNPVTRQMGVNDSPTGLGKLDQLVAEAKKRNLRLIIALLDFWAYTGGAQQMRAWHKGEDKHTFFFTDPRTRADFKAWVAHVLNRVNPLTGVAYKDEPAIFAWELMNEPYAKPARVFIEWVTEMSLAVKSIDRRHLVASGHANVDNRLSDLAIESIDFGTWHGYPLYYKLTNEKFSALIDEMCALGKRHQKPVLLEEFGLARSHPDQAQVYEDWLARLERNPDCAGWLVWRLVGRQDHGEWPKDEHDQFDIRDDGSPIWFVLKNAMARLKVARGATDDFK